MGERIILIRDCIYCGKTNDEIYFAPTCGFFTFKCEKCKKFNFITIDLKVKKVEDVTKDDVHQAISNASSMMDEKMIKESADDYYKSLKKSNNLNKLGGNKNDV